MSDDIDYRADELANAVIGMQKMINVKDAEIAALKEKVRDLQDGHDLHSDEFERIKSLYPDNPEAVEDTL